jgi:hypothetical protein
VPIVESIQSLESPTNITLPSQELISHLQNKIIDQEEQIQTLVTKRRDDIDKLKEFERIQQQLEQVKLT